MRPKTKDEQNRELRADAARIVAGVENYSGADRMKRGADVKAAWPPVKEVKKATKTAAKTTAKVAKTAVKATKKGPTPAGMSTGSHSGDLC